MRAYDAIIIGGGIAGASIGYELAADHQVCLLEAESTLASHTTGRSAATFLESQGSVQIRALTRASRPFYENPPDPFEGPLVTPLPLMVTAGPGQSAALRALHAEISAQTPTAHLLDGQRAREVNPLLSPGYPELALLEPEAMEIDVHAIHQGYVRGLRQRGGIVRTSARVVSAIRSDGWWEVSDASGARHRAATLVNAAGAWADDVAGITGAQPIGIQPLRRTIFMVKAPVDVDLGTLPMTADVEGTFYFKREGAQLLCSPADATPAPPGDARPDVLTIAQGLDTINAVTTLKARHITSSWAGLRSFAPDGDPAVGYDERAEGLFWFAGQGGFGIQTAPALAQLGSALFRGAAANAGLTAAGVEAQRLLVTRLRTPVTETLQPSAEAPQPS